MPARKRTNGRIGTRARTNDGVAPAEHAKSYTHPDEQVARPEVGTQERFRDKKPPKTWHYDVPMLPLFVDERLAPQTMLESVTGCKRDQQVDPVRRPAAGDREPDCAPTSTVTAGRIA